MVSDVGYNLYSIWRPTSDAAARAGNIPNKAQYLSD